MKNFHDFSNCLLEDITRLVDNELNNPEREKILRELIKCNSILKTEYVIQYSVKELFTKRKSSLKCTCPCKSEIEKKIKYDNKF